MSTSKTSAPFADVRPRAIAVAAMAHRNVWITLLTSFLFCSRMSLWMLVDAYVLFLPQPYGTASKVGIMEGACLVAFASMIIAGLLTDKVGRVPALYLCGVGYQLTGVAIAVAVLYLPTHGSTQSVFLMLCVAAGIAGFNQGLFFTASSALLGDSTPQNARNKYFRWKMAAATFGLSLWSTRCVRLLSTHTQHLDDARADRRLYGMRVIGHTARAVHVLLSRGADAAVAWIGEPPRSSDEPIRRGRCIIFFSASRERQRHGSCVDQCRGGGWCGTYRRCR